MVLKAVSLSALLLLSACSSAPYSGMPSDQTVEVDFVANPGPWFVWYEVNIDPPHGKWMMIRDDVNLISQKNSKEVYRVYLPKGKDIQIEARHSAGYYECELVIEFNLEETRKYFVLSRSDVKKGCNTGVFFQENGGLQPVDVKVIK